MFATSKPAEYGQNASANVRHPDKAQAGEVGDSKSVGIRKALAQALLPPSAKQEYNRIMRKYASSNSQNDNFDQKQYWQEIGKLIHRHMNPNMIYHVVHNHPNGAPLSYKDAEVFAYLGLAEVKMVHGQCWCSFSVQDSLDIDCNQLLAHCEEAERTIFARSDLFAQLSSQDHQTSQKAFLEMCRIYQQDLGACKGIFVFSTNREEVNDGQKD